MSVKNKVEMKTFLGMEVRVVNEEYLVLKDMFSALGRVKEDGTWTNEKKKCFEFLNDINKLSAHQTLEVTSKGKSRSRETQEMECLNINTVPIVLTQFKPTTRKGEEALNTWRKFIKFVDDMLTSFEVHRFIITDKHRQRADDAILYDAGGNPTIANKFTNEIMAILIGVYPDIKSIKKDELRIYQSQTAIDLLEARDFVHNKFVSAYEFTGSHKIAKEMTLKLALKKYDLENCNFNKVI